MVIPDLQADYTNIHNRRSDTGYIIVDLGNELLKAMLMGAYSTAVYVPHAIQRVNESKWEDIQARNKQKHSVRQDVSMFEYRKGKDVHERVIIGQNAEGPGQERQRTGGPKYDPNYYGPLFIRMALEFFPDGHDRLIVSASHPPGDIRFREKLAKSLYGTHHVMLPNGKKVKFKVAYVAVIDEPVGGMWNFLLRANGMESKSHIPDGLGSVFDIGGKISSIVPVRSNGYVDYNSARSLDLGIANIMDDMSALILGDRNFAKYFEAHRDDTLPHDDMMRSAVATGVYNVAGYGLNVKEHLEASISSFKNELRELYEQRLGGDRSFQYAIITGGGGGAMYDHLLGDVIRINPNSVNPSHDDLSRIHFANMYGGNKMLMQRIARGDIE